MNLRLMASLTTSLLAATFTLAPGDARACGGCFIPPTESTVVTAHRMALTISTKQTVLWDQIQYAGDPSEFAWVLPIKPGAMIEVATDAWFEVLDAATSVRVNGPPVNCNNNDTFGCGSNGAGVNRFAGLAAEDAAGGDSFNPASPPVTIVHRGTVGPYATVTLHTEVPGALNQWLDEFDYGVDPSTQPIIDAYVAEGFDFIALRLRPGEGVKEMKPVRVIIPGASPVLPLRMVAAGTGANVALTLFVIGEGRWAAKNFDNTTTPIDLLSWDYESNSSNYSELRKSLLSQNAGKTWLTSFAKPKTLSFPIANQYVQQAFTNGEITDTSCLMKILDLSNSPKLVVDPCPAGAPSNDPMCDQVPSDQIDARELECTSPEDPKLIADDLAVALTGLHPANVWVTRLEADLPKSALDGDLDLEAEETQKPVSNQLAAQIALNVEAACPSSVGPVLLGRGDRNAGERGAALGLMFAAVGVALALARRMGRPALGLVPVKSKIRT